jgi:hypothetical protein
MATATQAFEISAQKVQTRFVIELSQELAATLQEWFRKVSKSQGVGHASKIDNFALEVFELSLADYRFEQLPEREEERETQRHKITEAEARDIFEEFLDGECGVVELALKHRSSRSAIRRFIAKQEAKTGINAREIRGKNRDRFSLQSAVARSEQLLRRNDV